MKMKTNPKDPTFYNATHDINEFPTPKHDGYSGLTIREIFAKDLTAALLANPELTGNYRGGAFANDFCREGLTFADTLIKKLNEGKENEIYRIS